jgi:hypothetical protein
MITEQHLEPILMLSTSGTIGEAEAAEQEAEE